MKLRLLALGIYLFVVGNANAQTQTTGQISGVVADSTGAVVPKGQITALSRETGVKRTTESNAAGYYIVPLLDPGNYTVTVSATGLQTVSREAVRVEVGHSVLLDFRLEVGTLVEKVTVSTEPPLLEPTNPNSTTTFNAIQLAQLPNPGNDLSYVANLAPGAVMNTSNGSGTRTGNVVFNGLGATANDFTIDGLDANDPFRNVNSTGSSGLQLGLNAVQEVSVNTESYSVSQGHLSGAQINYVTKSGSNEFHGNAYELWNGSALNANNFFLNALGKPKPFSNVNQFGASVGGPILKNKLFFFSDLEGIRIVLPRILTSTLPTPAYQQYVLQQLPLGGTDSVFGTTLPPQPGEVALYQKMFSFMGDTSRGNALAVLGCPFDVGGGAPAVANDGNGCANVRTFSRSLPANETLFTTKLDYKYSDRNSFWFRFQINNGSRTGADAVNSIFDPVTNVPIRSGAASWTHVFSPNLVNQFSSGIAYRSAVQDLADPAKARAALPIGYFPFTFTAIGGFLPFTPSGDATTVWQLNDNVSWTHGRHEIKFGADLRRLLLTSFSGGNFVTPDVQGFSLPEFTFGATAVTIVNFPHSAENRVAAVGLETYVMDTVKATPKVTVTLGLRTSWNSDPVSRQSLFSRLKSSFDTLSHDVNRPLNLDIVPNQEKLYQTTPLLQWQPRMALAYQLRPKTVFRAGFGVFTNVIPAVLSDASAFNNPPSTNQVVTGLFVGGATGLISGVTNSAIDAAIAANQLFQSHFASGAVSCAAPGSPPSSCVPAVGFNEERPDHSGRKEYPYVMQWSSAIQQQLGSNFALTLKYVGTRGVKLTYQNTANAFQTACLGCFSPLPFNSAPDPRFSTVTSDITGANSSYHGLQVTADKRISHGLSLQVNYTYSRCIDNSSNGGGSLFNNNSRLGQLGLPGTNLRGSCDYDLRHALSGSYVYELPFHSTQSWLNLLAGGWQVSGTVFLRTGLPFTVTSAGFSSRIRQGASLYANGVPGQNLYTTANIPGVTQPGTIQWLNPSAFQSVIDSSTNSCFPTNDPQHCQNGSLGRNSVRGPDFKWTDLSIGKRFKITERFAFRFDAQFYNLFNHPNFGLPNSGAPTAGIPGKPSTLTRFGTINSMASPSSGLLGVGLGGDSSVRMVAVRGSVQW